MKMFVPEGPEVKDSCASQLAILGNELITHLLILPPESPP